MHKRTSVTVGKLNPCLSTNQHSEALEALASLVFVTFKVIGSESFDYLGSVWPIGKSLEDPRIKSKSIHGYIYIYIYICTYVLWLNGFHAKVAPSGSFSRRPQEEILYVSCQNAAQDTWENSSSWAGRFLCSVVGGSKRDDELQRKAMIPKRTSCLSIWHKIAKVVDVHSHPHHNLASLSTRVKVAVD